jgi:hypothetical protein
MLFNVAPLHRIYELILICEIYIISFWGGLFFSSLFAY